MAKSYSFGTPVTRQSVHDRTPSVHTNGHGDLQVVIPVVIALIIDSLLCVTTSFRPSNPGRALNPCYYLPFAISLEAIASMEAIASRLEAIASRLEVGSPGHL